MMDRREHVVRRILPILNHLEGGSLLEDCLAEWAVDDGLVWYPSSGSDCRDLMELMPARRKLHGLVRAPHLFVHTDVLDGWHERSVARGDILHSDPRTRVEVLAAEPIGPSRRLASTVGLEDAAFASRMPDLGGGWLMRVRCQSRQLGESEAWLLRLEIRNYDFFVRLALQAGLRIDTFVQVRQGLGCGGCRLGTVYLLPWLAGVGVRELICDGEFHGTADRFVAVADTLLREGAPADVEHVTVRHRQQPFRWSGYEVDAAHIQTGGRMPVNADSWDELRRAWTHPASRWAGG